jgi:D-alanyl-D-alanine carboxypeptidase
MLRRSLVALLLATCLVPSALGARRRAVGAPTRFDVPAADVAAQAALDANVPGVIIAVRYGGATFVEAYGVLDREAGTPMRWSDVLPLASVSKQFVATAIMRLVDEGRLRVDDEIRMFLPEFDARYEAITVEHLLTHTSGIPDYDTLLTDLFVPLSETEMVALIQSRPLEFPAGTWWSYSNSGFYLLAMIVQRLTGKRYDLYMDETFFAPYGLGETAECGSATPSGYIRSPFDGSIAKIPPMNTTLLLGAGALCSSALDLLQWNHILTSGLAVSPESLAKMRTPYRLSSGAAVQYGYGLATDSLAGQPRHWHNGLIPGYQSNLSWYPQLDLTVAVLVNISAARRDFASETADAVARSFFP